MDKTKFLHEKTKKAQQKEFVSKGRMQEYGKERYQKRLKQRELDEKSNLVTKFLFELQFGFTDHGDWYIYNNRTKNNKYYSKFEYFRGTHTQKERR